MQHLQTALDALVNVATDVVVGAAASSAEGYQAARDTAIDLRSEAALRDIVGPALHKFALGMSAEVERRAAPRFRSILAHPRRGREQLIDELDDAETELNIAIHAGGAPPAPARALRITLAIIRVRAITMALKEQAFADARMPKRGSAPTPRRRTVNAGDLGEDVARAVIAAVDAGDAWDGQLEPLRDLEMTGANRSGVATKILAFADMPDGRAILERIAAVARPHFPPLVERVAHDASTTNATMETDDRPNDALDADRSIAADSENLSTFDQTRTALSIIEIQRRQREARRQR